MSEITQARDWARRMQTAVHRSDCGIKNPSPNEAAAALGRVDWIHPAPGCGGCVTYRERELWKQQADEFDRYLGRPVAVST